MFRKSKETITVGTNGNGNSTLGETQIPAGSRLIIETAPDPNKTKDKNKKLPLWPFAVLAVVLIALLIIIIFVWRGLTKTTAVQVAVDDPRASAQKTADQRKNADALADKLVNSGSIVEARKEVSPAASPSPGSSAATQPEQIALRGYPYGSTGSPSIPAGAAGTVPSQTTQPTTEAAKAGSGQQSGQTATQSSTTQSAAQTPRPRVLPNSAINTQQSFRYKPKESGARAGTGGNGQHAGDGVSTRYSYTENTGAGETESSTPVVPPFGTMLPVRTLGAIYTLRSTSVVRLELTRAVSGNGWALPRGTVLVASLKDSEIDRAFLNVGGFIDPSTGKLVRLGGDVLGQDGGAGLKGKRRVVGSAWLRAASKVASSGLSLLQSALAGRNGGTTIVNGGQDPLATELNGIQQRNQRREFVEIQAGTFGYVLISDLPTEMNGQQPDLSGPDQQNGTELLNDSEIANLITSGTPEQIRAALPRMSSQLRAVAESLLRQ